MKTVTVAELEGNVSGYLELAEEEEILITQHGKPAGLLIGIESEDDLFDYQLTRDPRFLKRIEAARNSFTAVSFGGSPGVTGRPVSRTKATRG